MSDNKKFKTKIITGLMASICLLAGACLPFIPTVTTEDMQAEIDSAVQATITIMQPAGQASPSTTFTAAPTNTFSPTSVPSMTSTAQPTATPTEIPPSPTLTSNQQSVAPASDEPEKIYASGNTNCRSGPSMTYKVDGYFMAGDSSMAYEQDESGEWYYIDNPSKEGRYCWVWSETTYLEGEDPDVVYIAESDNNSSTNPKPQGPRVEDYLLINNNGNLTAICKVSNGFNGLMVVEDVSIADITKYKSYCIRQTCGWEYGYPCVWYP